MTKKERTEIEKDLQDADDKIVEALKHVKQIIENIEGFIERDNLKSDSTSGAVSQRLEEQVIELEEIKELIEEKVEDIEGSSGEILYVFQAFDSM